MKILYVEDQLFSNIPAIISMFGDFIGNKIVKRLDALEHDGSGFGGSNEEIAEILKTSPLDVAYTLPMALEKLAVQDEPLYEAFIIDRNLSDSGEDDGGLASIQEIIPNFTEEQMIRYCEREGDYLLHFLHTKPSVELKSQVFFLTANADDADAIRGTELFENLTSLDMWKSDNIIEKGGGAVQRLKDIIKGIPGVKIVSQNYNKFKAARTMDKEETQIRLLKIMQASDSPRWGKMNMDAVDSRFLEIRKLFEALTDRVCAINNINVQPNMNGRKTRGCYLSSLRSELDNWSSLEDKIASMTWEICGPNMHYNDSVSTKNLYKLAHNGILHLYEWMGKNITIAG